MSGLLDILRGAVAPAIAARTGQLQGRREGEQQASLLQQLQEQREARAAQMARQERMDASTLALQQSQLDENRARATALGQPKPVEQKPLIGEDGTVTFYDPTNPSVPSGFKVKRPGAAEAVPSFQPITTGDGMVGYDPKSGRTRAIMGPDGKPITPKPERAQQPTEFERKAALLAPRAMQAAKELDEFFAKGASPSGKLSGIPVLGQYFVPADVQRMNQAAEVVSTAILRLESGAAISEQEIKSYAKQFLPVAGDSPEVLAQKRQALMSAVAQLQNAAKRAMPDEENATPSQQGGTPLQAAYDRAMAALAAQGKNAAEIHTVLGPRP